MFWRLAFVFFCLLEASAFAADAPKNEAELLSLVSDTLNNSDPQKNTMELFTLQLPDSPEFDSGVETFYRPDLSFYEAREVGVGAMLPKTLPPFEFGPGRTTIVESINYTTIPKTPTVVELSILRTASVFKMARGALTRVLDVTVDREASRIESALLHRPLTHLSQEFAHANSNLGQILVLISRHGRYGTPLELKELGEFSAPRGLFSTTTVLPILESAKPIGDAFTLLIERTYSTTGNLESSHMTLIRRLVLDHFEEPFQVREAYLNSNTGALENADILIHRRQLKIVQPRTAHRDLLHRTTFCARMMGNFHVLRPHQ